MNIILIEPPMNELNPGLKIMAIAGWVFSVLVLIFIILLVSASIRYLMSKSDDEKLVKAKKEFKYALIAGSVAIIVLISIYIFKIY